MPTTYSEEMNHVFGYSTNTAGVFDPILMPHCNVTPMKQQQQPYAIADHFGSPSLAASDSTVTFDGSVTTCIANPTFITSSTPTKTCGPIKQHFGSVPPARPSALIPHTGAMSVGRALQGSSVAKVPLFAPEGSSTPIPLFPNTTGPNETLASMPQRECTPLLGQPLNPIVEREWQGQSFIPTPQKEWTVAPSQLPTPVHQKEWPHQTQKWTANDWSQESPFINNMAQCAKAPLHLVQSISDERCKNVINSPIRSEIQSGTGTTMRDHRMMEIPRGSNSTDDGFYSGGRSSVVGTPDEFYQASVRQNAVEDGVSWRSSNTTDESSSMFAAANVPQHYGWSLTAQTVASECAASGTLSSDANEDSVGGGYDIMSGLEKAIIDLSMLGLSDGDSTDINAKLN
ncbi:unnamed protein product [Toxocara canis]|uniref:Uncharacterized protein n=1 Tax=Toxocara canis TaxID=6265 RepID=A0A3P7H9V7_TOXCA|nr:unnamed protein product [Toxocara canis]